MAEPSKLFNFDFSDDGEALRIAVARAKFDVSCASQFRTEIDKQWNERIHRVSLDFTNVEFIDSSGIGALVSLQKRLDPSVSPLELLNPSPAVTTVVELLRLHRVFKLTHMEPPAGRAADRLPAS